MPRQRESSLAGQLARLGFRDPGRAERLLADPALSGLLDPLEDLFDDGLIAALSSVPQPDQALLGLVRLMESLARSSERDDRLEREAHPAHPARLRAVVRTGGPVRDRLMAVLGTSIALGDHLARHPGDWTALESGEPGPAAELRRELLLAVGADPADPEPVGQPGPAGYDALRRAYRRRLLAVAGRDLRSSDPARDLPEVAGELADLAQAALEAALAIARGEQPAGSAPCRLAVIGMGKTGGHELNYVSDVDVVFVAEARDGDERAALESATFLATAMMRACSASTGEGSLWPVDAALRPEGKAGPLVRTLASHTAYYQRWAGTWEFQALLKAKPVAGDLALGEAYVEALAPLVWSAAERPDFVSDVQAMRRRVEEHVPAAQAERQLKLGKGGLRDVEFSVQLLQLVHGRTDESLRSRTTLEALAALAAGGYVARDDAAGLDAAYRVLRCLEHRVQVHRLRRTHLMPTSEEDLRWLGRSMGHRANPAHSVLGQWQRQAREVRRLHERIFYRPLLAAVARLSPDEARLTPEAARERLSALGFRDTAAALRHISALTEGVSRRALMQRTLLPVMLGWFADEADPDAGLLAFRRVSEALGGSHWYLKMLRDSGSAAERLAHVLSRSRYAAELLQRAPEAALILGDDSGLRARDADALLAEVRTAVARHPGQPEQALEAARAVRRRELFRTAVADLVGAADLQQVGSALTDIAAAVIDGALELAIRTTEEQTGHPLPARVAVIGMGRFGGAELGYGSDADVVFVYDPLPGADEQQAQEAATAAVAELRRLLSASGTDPAIELDVGLRPEGKNGPLIRSLDSYRVYYERWSLVWEAQALLRARAVAGDSALRRAFERMVEPIRWPESGLRPGDVREIRRIKARVEAERLPKGADPSRHFKLGRGGLADVEWTVQLLQLRHAAAVESLRTTGTLPALAAAVDAGFLEPADGRVLADAWTLASRWRNAAMLWRGRPVDALPGDSRDRDGMARIVGYAPGQAQQAEDDYLRLTRRARGVVDRVFYAS